MLTSLAHSNTGGAVPRIHTVYVLKITHTIQQGFSKLHPSSHWWKQWKGEHRGSQGRRQLCGMESPPTDIHQTNTSGVFDLMCEHCWDTFYCAQQGKSISPSCIWRGFHLFWSSLRQAGVKIGVCFSLDYLRCTWFHRLEEKWCSGSYSTPCLGKDRIKRS